MSILKRIYLLIGLLIISAALVAIILVKHMRAQQNLYDEMNHFHVPTIFYTDKLIATLQEIKYTIKQNMTNRVTTANILKNPVYLIKSYALIINDLAYQYPDAATEHAHRRLQRDVALLTEVLQDHITANKEAPHEHLQTLILSTLIRAEQLNRLHANSNEYLRNQLAEREKNNVALLIQLTIAILLVGGILIIPLLASIRGMVRSLQNSEQQRQRELKEVAENERSRMHALLSAMSIGVLFEDKQGRIEFTNPSFNKYGRSTPTSL